MRGGIVRCAVAAVLFGVSAPAASRLTDDMGAFTLAGLLYLGAALAVAPIVARTPPTSAGLRSSFPYLATAVLLGGAVGPVLLALGLGLVPAATASLLLNLELVFTVVVASFVFREHVGGRVVAGTCLVAAGSVVLTWSGNPDLRWGAVLIAAACLCWAVDNSTTAAIDQIQPSHITLVKGVVAGGSNLAIGLATTAAPGIGPAASALTIGALGYGASITLWVSGARVLGAARAQLVFATAPFIGAIVAWTVFDEAVGPREAIAFVVAAGGVGFVLRSDHEHDHAHASTAHTHEHVHDVHHDHGHDGAAGPSRHTHRHEHPAIAHGHPHLPDLHHRHDH